MMKRKREWKVTLIEQAKYAFWAAGLVAAIGLIVMTH
jgi:hypothetical protein